MVAKKLDEIVTAFELLGDWDQRYGYLLELGEQLPFMPREDKTEDNRVKPCMSRVWVKAIPDPADPTHIAFRGDCDTAVIKGVLALLIQLCSGQTWQEIRELDLDEVFVRLRLDEHLSPNRHVGVYAIVDLMKSQAARLGQSRQVA